MNVKICGLTRFEDAKRAVELGAWALGFIFYPKSKRYISPESVQSILTALPDTAVNIKKVGVFVNPSLEELKTAVQTAAAMTAIQLHGNETEAFCQLVKETFPNIEVIKAMKPEAALEIETNADYVLIDHISEEAWGGTGQTVDWKKAAQIHSKKLILAGGLNAKNIKEAIQQVHPFSVDLSSGVEESPGIKSHEKLSEFFKAVRS